MLNSRNYRSVSQKSYDPFGMLLVGRSYHSGNIYRFSFQEQESDNEIYGDNNSYVFLYRICDARLGRFISVDPLTSKYSFNSPYAFSENRLIDMIELEGLEKTSTRAPGENQNGIYTTAIDNTAQVSFVFDEGTLFKTDLVNTDSKLEKLSKNAPDWDPFKNGPDWLTTEYSNSSPTTKEVKGGVLFQTEDSKGSSETRVTTGNPSLIKIDILMQAIGVKGGNPLDAIQEEEAAWIKKANPEREPAKKPEPKGTPFDTVATFYTGDGIPFDDQRIIRDEYGNHIDTISVSK